MTPHMEAIAFRIWQVAEPKGWDLTAHDIAEEIGVDARWVGRIANAKGWGTRLRASHSEFSRTAGMFSTKVAGVLREFDQ